MKIRIPKYSIIVSICVLTFFFRADVVLAAERYLGTPSSCFPFNQPCSAGGAQWNGREYTVSRGTYVIKNKCFGVDTTLRSGPEKACYCTDPRNHITNPRGEGYDTCDWPDIERYFSSTVGTRLGWEYGFCGTQQTDIRISGRDYFHSVIDMGSEVCSVPVSPVPSQTPTPTPTSTPAPTPTPLPVPVNLRVEYYRSDTQCMGDHFSAAGVADTIDRVGGPSNVSPDATSDNVAVWMNKSAGTYTLNVNIPGYHIVSICTVVNGSDIPDDGLTQTINPGDNILWKIGIRPPLAWVQTGGGDVYGFSGVFSSLPVISPQHAFSLAGPGGQPGVVIYGSSFDFSAGEANDGRDDVSSEKWLVEDKFKSIPLYSAFYTLLSSPTASTWSGGSPPTDCTICYATGTDSYTISEVWNIGSNQKLIMLIDGNLNIQENIHVADGGFLALIVNGHITVADHIGTEDISSTTPQIEGVFIANGTFNSGHGTKKLVAEGMFIANSFSLNRDFDSDDNSEKAAELFIYAPRFLVSMPEDMLETVLRWSEVNP